MFSPGPHGVKNKHRSQSYYFDTHLMPDFRTVPSSAGYTAPNRAAECLLCVWLLGRAAATENLAFALSS